jgi:hypothetical protein
MNQSLKTAVVPFQKDPRKSIGLDEVLVPGDVAVPTDGNVATRFESDPPVRPVHCGTGGSVSGKCQRFVT